MATLAGCHEASTCNNGISPRHNGSGHNGCISLRDCTFAMGVPTGLCPMGCPLSSDPGSAPGSSVKPRTSRQVRSSSSSSSRTAPGRCSLGEQIPGPNELHRIPEPCASTTTHGCISPAATYVHTASTIPDFRGPPGPAGRRSRLDIAGEPQ